MAVTRWDPFRELLTLQERLDKMYREMEKSRKEEDFVSSEWTPPVDIFELGETFVLKLEIPEVDKDSIDIKIHESELTIKGERKLEPGIDPDNYHRMERGYGVFTRSFSLTKTIDPSRIKAVFKDGILRIELPKKEEVKPKQIAIET
ncbi:MAG: Spore protein SP21 [Syntrophorhabdaceae bacterium PtaU1.Bin034]|nr:MAG: Spore protein SP21 [Syntrophorhabdaceae bacterium PtaU1.Bin034]